MDVLNGLRSDVFRTALVIVIPGFIAGSPLLVVLEYFFPGLIRSGLESPALSAVFILVGASLLGMIAAQFGSRIEVSWIDRILEREIDTFQSDWTRYLRSTLPDNLVAKGYISGRVLHLQFELSMAAAFGIFGASGTWAWLLYGECSCGLLLVFLTVVVCATAYFAFEAKSTAKLLANIRKELLSGIGSEQAPIAASIPVVVPPGQPLGTNPDHGG